MKTRTSLILLTLAVLGLVAVQPAHAATIDWSATAGDATWATDANWDGTPPTAPADNITDDIARFNKTSYTFQPDGGTRSINGIEIGNGTTVTAELTISGTALTIGANGVTMYANAGTAIISSPVTLGDNQIWTNNSANTLTASGAIGGNYNLTKSGDGTLILGGNNTMGDTVNVLAGQLTLASGTTTISKAGEGTVGSLKVSASGVTIASGATVTVSPHIS